jgi:hypothetical protein
MPATGFISTATFTYRASDGSAQSNVATVTIQVTASANAAPVAANDSATTNRGNALTLAVLANDSDADGNALTVTALTQPISGAVVLNANGTVTYTPCKLCRNGRSLTRPAMVWPSPASLRSRCR